MKNPHIFMVMNTILFNLGSVTIAATSLAAICCVKNEAEEIESAELGVYMLVPQNSLEIHVSYKRV